MDPLAIGNTELVDDHEPEDAGAPPESPQPKAAARVRKRRVDAADGASRSRTNASAKKRATAPPEDPKPEAAPIVPPQPAVEPPSAPDKRNRPRTLRGLFDVRRGSDEASAPLRSKRALSYLRA